MLRDERFLSRLTPAEKAVLPYFHNFWLRPEQHLPSGLWRYFGVICGRGWGKSHMLACEINRRAERGLLRRGEPAALAMMAPNDERVEEVQVSFLLSTAPPWCKPELYKGNLIWPNGVIAELYTPLAPGRPRSGNFQLSWLCELVDWNPNTRKEAFDNITTATRIGGTAHPPQVLWDTTSKGLNDVIQHLQELNKENPELYPIQRGSMFDNPLLTALYLQTEARKYTGRRYEEEIEGKVFDSAQGALWDQARINRNRLYVRAHQYDQILVCVDPAISTGKEADETGIVEGGRRGTEIDVLEDFSGKHTPEAWGDIIVQRYKAGAAGCVLERNRGGDPLVSVVRARAKEAQLQIRELPDDDNEFPRRTEGVIYVKEVTARDSKSTRATAPAAHYEANHVHHIGVFDELEVQLTTYVPGTSRSPNRYDALVYLVLELSGLEKAQVNVPPGIAAPDMAAAHAALLAAIRNSQRAVRVGL